MAQQLKTKSLVNNSLDIEWNEEVTKMEHDLSQEEQFFASDALRDFEFEDGEFELEESFTIDRIIDDSPGGYREYLDDIDYSALVLQ